MEIAIVGIGGDLSARMVIEVGKIKLRATIVEGVDQFVCHCFPKELIVGYFVGAHLNLHNAHHIIG